MAATNRYTQIIERIFLAGFREGSTSFEFEREELIQVAGELGISLPKNIGDVIYSFRYRTALPRSIRATAPAGMAWLIRSRYRFVLSADAPVVPNPILIGVWTNARSLALSNCQE